MRRLPSRPIPIVAEPSLSVYGTHWCPDCRRAKAFLGDHQIPYAWINIEEDAAAEQLVIRLNEGKRIIPTIVFDDGTRLVEPGNAELAAKLGLKTSVDRKFWPLICVGAGPAALVASIYTTREGIDTLLLERGAPGGQATRTFSYENVPGFPDGVEGNEFANRLLVQARRFGGQVLEAVDVVSVSRTEPFLTVRVGNGDEYTAHAVLVASGSRYRTLGVPGEADFIGAGIHFCSTCDGPFYRDKAVAVIGGGASAAEEAVHLTRFAARVTVLVRGTEFKASPAVVEKLQATPAVEVRYRTEVGAFLGRGGHLTALQLNTSAGPGAETLDMDGAFVFVGLEPNTDFLDGLDVVRDRWGFIETGHALEHADVAPDRFGGRRPLMLETSVPGVFAAGDVRAGSTKQVAAAAGEGASAALVIRDFLKSV